MLLSVSSIISSSLILLLVHSGKVCGQSSDSCDWVGSGLLQPSPPAIQPLYLRCERGSVRWHYPRAALRALLRPPSMPLFQACLKIHPSTAGATIYLEGDDRLYPLYRKGSSDSMVRCFKSSGGRAAVYIEADPPPLDILRKDVVEFSYDLMPVDDVTNDNEECRPCTDDEVLTAYCTSDFVIEGTVSSLRHNETMQTSQLRIRTSSFKSNQRQPDLPDIRSDSKFQTLHIPSKCGTKPGKGTFVFFTRWRLGVPFVKCAPRLVHWKAIRRKALQEGTNQCQLN